MKFAGLLGALLLLTACQETEVVRQESDGSELRINEWPLPATAPSAQPDLTATSGDHLLLSWIESQDDSHALKLSEFDGKAWSAPRTVAQGDDWFVNWADTPHVAASGNALWAHWLRKSGAGGYAYDVVLSRSDDQGANWSTPIAVNTDGKSGEHGFVSMWPEAAGGLGIAWLDGRNAGGEGHGGHEGHGGAMTLRTATFDAVGQRLSESELDARTCDCCQTAMAQTSRGPLLAWRDRDEDEIRDIVVARRDGTAWTPPRKVHDDGWKMP
ncbi:MAG TPA: sialidase family protein, partial [Pseudoxanthomonas sp.]|nr:sialidase family protein [Pseudoxanthomonas sp.]